MKVKILLLMFCAMSLGIFSCKKCITCTYANSQSSEDYCSLKQADRDNITKQYQAAGGSCIDK